MSAYISPMSSFEVAAWERGKRRKALRRVEADSAQHAVRLVAADHSDWSDGGVYMAWPTNRPSQVVKVTIDAGKDEAQTLA